MLDNVISGSGQPQTASEERWVVDRKIPLSIVVALLGQLATGAWCASELWHQQGEDERRIALIETSIVKIEETIDARGRARDVAEAEIKQSLANQAAQLARIDEALSILMRNYGPRDRDNGRGR